MKKVTFNVFVLLLLSLLFYGRVYSQVVVTDPVATANLNLIHGQLVTQTASMTGHLTTTATQVTATATTVANTLSVLKAIENKLVQINAAITTTIYVKNIVQREREILRMQAEISKNIQKMGRLTPEELLILNNNILIAVRTTESFIILTNSLLTEGFLRMGDDSRLSQFFSIDNQLAIQQSIMKTYYIQYAIIDEERAILGAVRK
ncbi:MAG: hypothetical protein AB9846_18010 [Tenuifilaceae bacterium]